MIRQERDYFLCTFRLSTRSTFPRQGYPDPCHTSRFCGVDAHLGVFEDQAPFRWNAEPLGGHEERFRIGLALHIVAGTNKDVEAIRKPRRSQGGFYRFPRAAGDDSEGDASVLGFDVGHYFGNCFQFRQVFVVKSLLAMSDLGRGHGNAVFGGERLHDVDDRHATQLVVTLFGKRTAPIGERVAPRKIVEGHGIHNGSVAIEEVSGEFARRKRKF
jgi:hypothetical protein